ncbi:MAG: tRNA lysidine(34) synthetase TilS [Clostridia bacterium]|nr:tRNA lysidine(34) synthetase TilS [Clostridia bacterium]
MVMKMLDKVIKANNLYGLLDNQKEITVAFSGGADSVCLLHLLNSLKDEFGFKLYAAHYNHGIRGEEADNDQKFARDFCKKLSVPFITEKGDVITFAKNNKMSIELAARQKRYEFLSSVAKGVIATAHTASDNLETMIFNLVRGTSLDGIKGIPPKRDNIIRPLIFCTRDEIESYCLCNGLSYVTDSTNSDDDCSRNIIRHKIIPVLKEINSASTENASRLSVILSEDGTFLNDLAKKEFSERLHNGKLLLDGFNLLKPSISKRVLSLYYKENFDRELDSKHIEEMLNVCLKNSKRTSLFDDICAENENGYLVFSKTNQPDTEFFLQTELMSISKFNRNKKIHNLLLNCAIDCDKIVGNLRRINRNSSDKIKLANSNSTKTIKKLLTEKAVSVSERKNLPIYSDDLGVVWAYKIGTADRVKIDNKTKTVLYFKTEKIGENKNYGDM